MRDRWGHRGRRLILLWTAFGIVLLVNISGCGGGSGGAQDGDSSPDTEPPISEPSTPVTTDGAITVLEAGSAPLQELSIRQSAEIKSNVQASSEQVLVAGNAEDRTTTTADFNVRISLSSTEQDIQISMIPVLNAYSADNTLEPSDKLPGSWQRTYTDKGALTDASSNDSKALISYNTDFLFAFPGLVLAVPDEPIGKGAHWAYAQEVSTGAIQTEIQLVDISSDNLSVSISIFYLPADDGTSVTYSNTLQATYDRASLVMHTGTSTLEIGQSYTVSVNGQATQYQATDRIVHTIGRVEQ